MRSAELTRCCLVTALLLLGSCDHAPNSPKSGSGSSREVYVAHQPPSAKDLIAAVLASQDVSLQVSSTCHNVGTEPSDATIGRYLAGFLAEMSSPDKKNWLETASETGTSARGEPVWVCNLTLRHVDGDDRWGWGVSFQVRRSDGLVLAESFICTGAG